MPEQTTSAQTEQFITLQHLAMRLLEDVQGIYLSLFYSILFSFSSLLFSICIAHVIRRPGQVLARRSGLR